MDVRSDWIVAWFACCAGGRARDEVDVVLDTRDSWMRARLCSTPAARPIRQSHQSHAHHVATMIALRSPIGTCHGRSRHWQRRLPIPNRTCSAPLSPVSLSPAPPALPPFDPANRTGSSRPAAAGAPPRGRAVVARNNKAGNRTTIRGMGASSATSGGGDGGDDEEVGALGIAAAAVGLPLNGIVLWSEYTLATTGAGLPPGPGGILGAAEGIGYLVVLGLVAWSLKKKISSGSGLPAGPGGIIGAAEGVSYLSLLGAIGAFGWAATHGGVPGPLGN